MGAAHGMARIGDNEWVKGKWKHGFMEFIHEVNRLCIEADIEPVFGEPTMLSATHHAPLYCEEYPRAAVLYEVGERRGNGEGYRIVTHDRALWPIWEVAMMAVEPRLEIREKGNPNHENDE